MSKRNRRQSACRESVIRVERVEGVMNEQLSILELVSNATIVVQLVMALLVLASVVSWILVFRKRFCRSVDGWLRH